MKFILAILFVVLLSPALLHAQNEGVDCFVTKEFVIVLSTKSYPAALKMAKSIAKQTAFKLDLRDLKPNKKIGLSSSKKECMDGYGEFPCYEARGTADGNYVSIEYSSQYDGFAKGFYIVIISSGDANSPDVQSALTTAKQFVNDAYKKQSKVYVCCTH